MSSISGGSHVLNNESEFQQFLDIHRLQLVSSRVPECLWGTLFYKLKNKVYDAGDVFMMTYVDEEEDEDNHQQDGSTDEDAGQVSETHGRTLKIVVVKEEGLQCDDPNNIFLIDHAWTYRTPEQARQQLSQIPGLLQRMIGMMGVKEEPGETTEHHVESILKEMWKYNQTYSVSTQGVSAEEKQPIWYVLDEFGCRIRHDDEPSFALVPFIYTTEQIAFSILFPFQDVEYADEVTRDFAHHTKDPLLRQIRLLPWQPRDLTHLPTDQPEPDEDYMSLVCSETPPDNPEANACVKRDRPLKVYTTDQQIIQNLKHPSFVCMTEHEKADILWLSEAWKDFPVLSSCSKYINQFPGEKLLITKDMLAVSGRRAAITDQSKSRRGPKWLPVTFNLNQELPQFVSYFQQQEKKGEENTWIVKPFNLARGLDTTVSNNLNQIVRLTETNVPKVACKYIADPVLFHRNGIGPVKFDLRFILLLSSVKPLKLYAYKIFWIRFANKVFSLDQLDDYEKHFTVMNYAPDETDWHQMLWKDFMPEFESQFPDHTWGSTEGSMHAAIKELFEGAASKPHPFGLTHSPQSRAMYGIDAMLQWETDEKGNKCMQPVLLECNFLPDCERACWHRQEYFDDVFSTLFLDDIKDRPVVLL